MPPVTPNRIYRIRSTVRTPVLNPVSVPDAAGAYDRAVRPGFQAQLQISRQNAALDNDRRRSRYEAIASGIRTFGQTVEAFDRARERQEAEQVTDMQNAYRKYMLDNRKAIDEEEYRRTYDGDGKMTITGPFSKAIEVHDGFKTSQDKAYNALRGKAKQRFDEWYEMEGAKLQAASAYKQAELRKEYTAQGKADAVTLTETQAHRLEAPDKLSEWSDKLEEVQAATEDAAEWAMGLKDSAGNELRTATPEELEKIQDLKRGKYDALNFHRLQHIQRLYVETGNPALLSELQAWGMTGEEYKAEAGKAGGPFAGENAPAFAPSAETEFRETETRDKVREMASQAEAKREEHLRRQDGATMEANAESLSAFSATTDREEHETALAGLLMVAGQLHTPKARLAWQSQIESAMDVANGNLEALAVRDMESADFDIRIADLKSRLREETVPARRQALQKTIDDLELAADKTNFATQLNLAEKTIGEWENDGFQYALPGEEVERDAMDALLERMRIKKEVYGHLEEKAGELRTEAGRTWAMESIWKLRNDFAADRQAYAKMEGERKAARVRSVMMASKLGRTTVFDENGSYIGDKPLTIPELVAAFSEVSGDMTQEQSEEVMHDISTLASRRAQIPTGDEILHALQWMGVHTPDAVDMTALYSQGVDGWSVNTKAFVAMDASKADRRDGFVEVKRSRTYKPGLESYTIKLSQDALDAVLDALMAYKRQATLPDHLTLEEVLQKRLNGIRDTITNDSVIEALRESAREYDEQFLGMVTAP